MKKASKTNATAARYSVGVIHIGKRRTVRDEDTPGYMRMAPGGDFLWGDSRAQAPGDWRRRSFTHVDDAASAALPEFARRLGAKAPFRIPKWLGRLAVGEAGVFMMTESCGSSNAKAKSILKWTPLYPTWREGFRMGMIS